MESVFYGFETLNLKTMTNEKIYENVMGHKPSKEFGVKGSFSWDDIDALMNAVKNCSIPAVIGRSEQLVLFADWLQYNGKWDLPEKQVKKFLEEQKQN